MVSAVVVSFHTGEVLLACLQSLENDNAISEVILVDNGNPETLIVQTANYKKVIRISGQGNVGFAKGCNLGARTAKEETLLFLNPDCVLQENTMARLLEAKEKHTDSWLITAQQRNQDGTLQKGGKRNLLTPKIALSHALALPCICKSAPSIHLPETEADGTEYVPAVSGACMLISKTHYKAVDGMDEGYFLHVEDLDFCKKIHDAGGKMLYVGQAYITHQRSSSNASKAFVEKHKAHGFYRYFTKHYNMPYLGLMFLLRYYLRYGITALMMRARKGH